MYPCYYQWRETPQLLLQEQSVTPINLNKYSIPKNRSKLDVFLGKTELRKSMQDVFSRSKVNQIKQY